MKRLLPAITLAATALVALSGCVAYPANDYRVREQYGADRDWERHHDGRHHHDRDYEDRDSRDERARGQ